MSNSFLLPAICLLIWASACQSSTSNVADSPDGNPYTALAGIHSIEEATADLAIDIEVAGLNGGTAKMIGISGDQNYIIDTAVVDPSGKFSFRSPKPWPSGLYFAILPDNSNIQMIIDANQHFSLKTRQGNIIADMQITNSKENELLYGNLRTQQPMDQQIKTLAGQVKMRGEDTPEGKAIQAQVDSALEVRKAYILSFAKDHPKAFFTKYKICGQNPELTNPLNADGSLNVPLQTFTYREELWDNVDFTDTRLLRTPIIANKLNRYIKELTPQIPDSIIFSADRLIARAAEHPDYFKFIVNYIPLTYKPGEVALMDAEAVLVHMVKNYFTPEKATWSSESELAALKKQASEMENSLVGKKGMDVEAIDQNGTKRSIYEMTADYIVVFMWNPECSHCKEETPQLIQIAREWKGKLDVFGIAVNTTEEAYKKASKEYGMTWNTVFDPTNKAIYAKYYVDNTPEIYVLNPERIIIGKNLKAHQVVTVVEKDIAKRRG